jgi:hypothetical protein
MRPILRRVFQGDLERLATMVAVERATRARDAAAEAARAAEPAPRKRQRKAAAAAPVADAPNAQAEA